MQQRLAELTDNLAGRRVLVVGDYMLDRYLWGDATRISPEAPVPVVRIEREEFQPGGAGNVVRNLCALGVEPIPVGVAGKDRFGELMLGRLELLGAPTEGLIAHGEVDTIVKTRVIARGQQMLRIDEEGQPGLPDGLGAEIATRSVELLEDADGVIFSDYAKGVALSRRGGIVREVVQACRAAGKPIYADTKPANFALYEGITLLTPNEKEAREAARLSGVGTVSLDEIGRVLCRQMGLEALAITRGARGMLLIEADGSAHHLPGVLAEVVDVTGAGDTVLSVMSVAMLAGGAALAAAALANLAGGLVVQRVGCATVNAEDLQWGLRTRADYIGGLTD